MVIFLVAALLSLILLNIVTRELQAALFWVDELAIYTMVWMAFVGASAMVRMRAGVAVTIVVDLLPPVLQRGLARLVDAIVLVFAITLLVLCWLWYDPIALARSGFDFERFAESTFKFIYSEPTSTIGIPKFWVWLAVPVMAIGMTIHALANLGEGMPFSGSDPKGSDPERSDPNPNPP
ncbi:MAG TPA: TRAP transporter small permease subunit [Gammaproteobacteria bacterium]|nr:TRAP transporter small permease subunit [Gammaproteobacteria bacterium]